jgi:hypothetical protein
MLSKIGGGTSGIYLTVGQRELQLPVEVLPMGDALCKENSRYPSWISQK